MEVWVVAYGIGGVCCQRVGAQDLSSRELDWRALLLRHWRDGVGSERAWVVGWVGQREACVARRIEVVEEEARVRLKDGGYRMGEKNWTYAHASRGEGSGHTRRVAETSAEQCDG